MGEILKASPESLSATGKSAIGPEKGTVHLAIAAVLKVLWAKQEGKKMLKYGYLAYSGSYSWLEPDQQLKQSSGLNFPFSPFHRHNTVIFKYLLQARALSCLQIDSCRLGSVNESLSVMLMAKKFQRKALQNAAAMRKSFSPYPSKQSD
ncbi:mitochondrial enolase superfamily member 1 [Geothlypis trichas]